MNFRRFVRNVVIIVGIPFILAFIGYTIKAYWIVYETLFWAIIAMSISSIPLRDALKVPSNIPKKEKLPEIIGRQPLFRRNDMLKLVMPLLVVIIVLVMFVIGIGYK